MMDDSLLPKLRRAIRQVVRKAAEAGGSLEREEFTQKSGRRDVGQIMGLEDGELDESKWKAVVKEMFQEAIVSFYFSSWALQPRPAPSQPNFSRSANSKCS